MIINSKTLYKGKEMKQVTSKLLLFVAIAVLVLSGCSGNNTEKRIAELEAKLDKLQSNPGAVASPVAATTTTPSNVKPEGPLPSLEWAETEWDFGTINEGDVVEHIYIFENTGEAPLIIESAKPSCGCTVPSWSKEPIPVGGSGEILVKFDSKGKPNIQTKTVTITSNTWPKVTTLRFKTFVTPKAK